MNPEFSFERAPQPIGEALKDEIKALWQSEGISIPDAESRLAQIRYFARIETGEIAGVCSSTVEKGIFNGLLFHSMRVMVASAYRQNLLAFDLLAHLVEDLKDNRQDNLESEPVGVKVVIQTPIVAERGAIDCSRTFQFPINKAPINFVLSGFTPKTHPEYCHYFTDNGDSTKATEQRWATTTEAFSREASVQPITQDSLSTDEEDIRRLLQLADNAKDPEDKALYSLKHNGQLAAVCELVPRFIPEINANLLGIRTHLSRSTDKLDIQGCFAREIHTHLNRVDGTNPQHAVGLFLVYTGRTRLPPVCPVTGFHLHGVDAQGRELRVRFFDEIKVKVPLQK